MVEIICEFVVKEHNRGQFELTYGPGGAWSKLFARCPGFRGITVLRDIQNPQRYLTVDLWDSAEQREQARVENQTEYSDLEAILSDWTASRTEVGIFSVLAEATVRSRNSVGRGKTGEIRRRSRQTQR